MLPSSNTATLVSGDFFISSYAEKIPPGPAPIIITSYSIHYPPTGNFLEYYIIESGLCGIVLVLIRVFSIRLLIDEQGIIIKANDKVKAADDAENMLKELS